MIISVNINMDRHIEDKSITLFTLCKKSVSAERRKEFRLMKRAVEVIKELFSYPFLLRPCEEEHFA